MEAKIKGIASLLILAIILFVGYNLYQIFNTPKTEQNAQSQDPELTESLKNPIFKLFYDAAKRPADWYSEIKIKEYDLTGSNWATSYQVEKFQWTKMAEISFVITEQSTNPRFVGHTVTYYIGLAGKENWRPGIIASKEVGMLFFSNGLTWPPDRSEVDYVLPTDYFISNK